jgi:O-antigen/teichoic acid export membrane protein
MHEARQKIAELLRNLLIVGAGNYGAMGVSLVVNAVLTRWLGAEQFGHLALLLTASQVLALVGANWTQAALVRFGAREFAASGTVADAFWTRIWIVTPWLAGAAALTLAARQPLAAYLMIPAWGLLIVAAHFLAAFLVLTIGAIFQARNEMRRYGLILFLDKAAMAASLLLFLGSASVRSPLALLGAYAASSAGVALWGISRLGRSLLPAALNRDSYRQMAAFSLPLLLSGWVGLFGTNWFDILIIRRYRPLSDVGLYSLATVLAGVVQQVTIIFSTLLLPQLSVMVARGELDKIRVLVDRFLPYWFLAAAVLFSVVVLAAAPLVPLIFGPAFRPAAPVLVVLMLAACALAIFNTFAPLVSAFGATWALTGAALISGAVNVAMDFLLIPAHGLRGAAAATVLSYGMSAVLVLSYTQWRLGHNVFRVVLLMLPVVVVCAGFLMLDTIQFYLLAAPAGILSVFWLMHQFKLFRSEDAMFVGDLTAAIRRAS